MWLSEYDKLRLSRAGNETGGFFKQTGKHALQLLHFVLLLLSLVILLAGCGTTTKLVSPITQKEELSLFSKQTPSTPYQTYQGERLSKDKTATIAVSSNMMATDKEGIGIHNLSINNYKINFMEDFDKRPQYYQLEILPGQNRLETTVKWFYKPVYWDDYINTHLLKFNAKAGTTYFLQIYEKKPKEPHPIPDCIKEGVGYALFPYMLMTYPLWSWAVDDEYDYDYSPRFVWIWDSQTEQVVAGIEPKVRSNDQDSNTE